MDCLPNALNDLLEHHGLRIPFQANGPFQALNHGNRWLEEIGFTLVPCDGVPFLDSAEYVHWQDNHFTAMVLSTGFANDDPHCLFFP